MNWVEVECSFDTAWDNWTSKRRYYGWVFIARNVGDSPYRSYDRDKNKLWHFECPCPCKRNNDFRQGKAEIPKERNSIILICRECGRKIARILGLVKEEDVHVWLAKETCDNG